MGRVWQLSIDDEALEQITALGLLQHQISTLQRAAAPNLTYAPRKFVFIAGAVWLSLAGGAFADVILKVSYPGGASSHFDRDYYVKKHSPLVQKSWGAYGLKACSAFFPSDDRVGVVAVAVCKFKDRQSLDNAFNSSATAAVLEDVKKFTDIPPNRTIATPF